MGVLDPGILEKILTAAGIIAGFAFSAGCAILMIDNNDKPTPKIVNCVWQFMLSSFLLISSSVSLSIMSNYSQDSRFGTTPIFIWTTRVSVALFALGLFLLFLGINKVVSGWGKSITLSNNKVPGKCLLIISSCLLFAFMVFSFFSCYIE